MTISALKPLRPLDEALADLESPEAISDRRRRALAWAIDLQGAERRQMIHRPGQLRIHECYLPVRIASSQASWASSAGLTPDLSAAEQEAGVLVNALVQEECEALLLIQDRHAVHEDPDRVEETSVWLNYCSTVSNVAWQRGNGSAEFIAKWQDLIQRRAEAAGYGDPTGAIDLALERMGTPYPHLPEAAWAAADRMGDEPRAVELERLTLKYGPRPAAPAEPELAEHATPKRTRK